MPIRPGRTNRHKLITLNPTLRPNKSAHGDDDEEAIAAFMKAKEDLGPGPPYAEPANKPVVGNPRYMRQPSWNKWSGSWAM